MKFITTHKSKNYNSRGKHKIKMVVIHYTAGTKEGDLRVLCGHTSRQVSSHYYIDKSGNIYYLVKEKYNAWHAGKSKWKGYEINLGSIWKPIYSVNPVSIGIEIENKNFESYTEEQIKSLIELLKDIKSRYQLKPDEIVGHNEVSPGRKVDPGYHFPWDKVKREIFATQDDLKKDQKPSDWAELAWEWAKEFKYYVYKKDGTRKLTKGLLTKDPKKPLTRQELAVILFRYNNAK
jgi:N-acetylmuramoyl-L-alanine amidase